MFCFFVYLSFILISLSNIIIVGIYFEMNGIPIKLCFISVIWKWVVREISFERSINTVSCG